MPKVSFASIAHARWSAALLGTGLVVACGDGAPDPATDAAGMGSAGATSAEASGGTTSGGSPATSSATGFGTVGDDAHADDGGGHVPMPDDDEFEEMSLSDWEVIAPEQVRLSVSEGQLHLEPAERTLWFNERSSSLVFKPIEGDFMVTARVTARSLERPTAVPDVPFRLGGLMVRHPDSDRENYVFIALGADANDISVETKNTIDGQSNFEGPPWPGAQAQLRVCRVGDRLELLVGNDDQWESRATYDRPDLPSVVQVGPMAYANVSPADLRVSFDYVRFAQVDASNDCMR